MTHILMNYLMDDFVIDLIRSYQWGGFRKENNRVN